MVTEVLEAMAEENFRRAPKFNAPLPHPPDMPPFPIPAIPKPDPHEPVLAPQMVRLGMAQGVAIAGGRMSVEQIEESLAAYAASKVRMVARSSQRLAQAERVPWWRGLDFSSGAGQVVAVGAGVAGGGFLFNWARQLRMMLQGGAYARRMTAGWGGGSPGPGSGQQG